MEFRRLYIFVLANCILIQYLEGKTVSLNDLIAAERRAKHSEETFHSTKLKDQETEETSRQESNEIQTSETKIKRGPKIPPIKLPGLLKRSPLLRRLASKAKLARLKLSSSISAVEKLSPLSIRKAFQIKSPLKPKKLKVGQRLRHKRKNQYKKREINQNDNFSNQYIPVLKGLGVLFDNLLESDTSDSYEIKPKNYKTYRFDPEQRHDLSNAYSSTTSSRVTRYKSPKKATHLPSSTPTKISSNTKNFSYSKNNDYSTVRPNKGLPTLLSRNTTGSRRNNIGTSKRSSTTFYRDFKGNIARDYGDDEHNTRRRKNESGEEGNENDTDDASRNESSSIGQSRGRGLDSRHSKDRQVFDSKPEVENTTDNIREIQLEARGDKIEGKSPVREPVRRLRGSVPKEKISDERVVPKPLQSEKVHEESILSATNNSPCNKRVIDKGSPLTSEDENVRKGNETIILVERNSPNTNHAQETGKKVPVVMIFDGYSVTRDKNGENKVSGKTIHIHSKTLGNGRES